MRTYLYRNILFVAEGASTTFEECCMAVFCIVALRCAHGAEGLDWRRYRGCVGDNRRGRGSQGNHIVAAASTALLDAMK